MGMFDDDFDKFFGRWFAFVAVMGTLSFIAFWVVVFILLAHFL